MEEIFIQEGKICVRKNIFDRNKQTIIFIHGLSGSLSSWKKYEDSLQEKYNVISYDLRGHGKSFKYQKYYDYKPSCFSDDLNYIVEYFGLNNITLVSHSFGTMVAVDYMINHQEKISKSIFLSPSFMVKNKPFSILLYFIIFLLKLIHKIIPMSYSALHIDYGLYPWKGDWYISRMIADIKNTGLLIYLFCTRQTLNLNYETKLNNLLTPVLLLHGDKDSIVNVSDSHSIHRKIKNSQLIIIKKANHFLIFNNFQEVKKIIISSVG